MKITERTACRIRLIYGALLSLLIIVAGGAFIAACCAVNARGANPFTYEAIAEAFSAIALPVYLALAALVGGFVIFAIFPTENAKLKGTVFARVRLERAARQRDLDASPEAKALVLKERRLRRRFSIVNFALLLIGVAASGAYVLNVNNYSKDYNSDVKIASLVILFAILPSAILLVLRGFIDEASCNREIKILQNVPKTTDNVPGIAPECPILGSCSDFVAKHPNIIPAIKLSVLGFALVLIILGIFNGGMKDVVEKAIKICTECIGLG